MVVTTHPLGTGGPVEVDRLNFKLMYHARYPAPGIKLLNMQGENVTDCHSAAQPGGEDS